jgi:hypothetical protein
MKSTVYIGENDGDYSALIEASGMVISRKVSSRLDVIGFVRDYAGLIKRNVNGDTGRLVDFSGRHSDFVSKTYGSNVPENHARVSDACDDVVVELSPSDDDLKKIGLYVEPRGV